MALLQTYSSANEVVSEGLVVKYSIEMDTLTLTAWHPADPSDPDGAQVFSEYDLVYYRCTRYATKRYSFIGMDYTTAMSCAAAKVTKYTRGYSKIVVVDSTDPDTGQPTKEISTQTSTLCSSDVVPRREGDAAIYSVEIAVNEVDEKPSLTLPANVTTLFTAENARDYD